MEQLNSCCVCLKSNLTLVHICEADCNDMKWIQKLSSCVPEVLWCEEYLICNKCTDQLEIASTFRKLCLQSYIEHQRNWKTNVNDIEKNVNFEAVVDNILGMVNEIKGDVYGIRAPENETRRILDNSQIGVFPKIDEISYSLKEDRDSASVLRHLLQTKSDTVENKPSTSRHVEHFADVIVIDDEENDSTSSAKMVINEVKKNSKLSKELIEHSSDAQTNYCESCKINFRDRIRLAKHNRSVHDLEYPWDNYNKNFKMHKRTQSHDYLRLNQNKSQSKIGLMPLKSGTGVIPHTVSYEEAWAYKCPQCSLKYPKRHMLKQHVQMNHTHPGGDYVCFHCSEGFSFKSGLVTHLASEHDFKTKQCRFCKNLYGTQGEFDEHLQREHNVILRKKKYRCKKCSISHSSLEDRDSHRGGCNAHTEYFLNKKKLKSDLEDESEED